MRTLMLQMLWAFVEFERTLIKERQRESIEAGEDKSAVVKAYGISRPTLYKLLAA